MDELKKRRLKNGVIEQLQKRGFSYDVFETMIDIYVGLLLEKEILEQRFSEHKGPAQSEIILLEVLQNLNEDITAYKECLGI